MKWLNLLLICVAVLVMNACEKHSSAEINLIRMENEKPVPTPANQTAAPVNPGAAAKPPAGYL